MANHKSAEKRNRQNQVRRMRNKSNRTRMKSVIKKIELAMDQQSAEGAQEALKAAIPVIQRTAVKGAIHRKNASRKVSRLTRRVNAFISSMQ